MFLRYLSLLGDKVAGLGGDPSQIEPSPNGYDGLPGAAHPHRPHRHEAGQEVTGKIEGLVYDHFGDFDGFILELRDGRTRHFTSREAEIETLVRDAWQRRFVTTIIESRHDPCVPAAVILRRSTALENRRDWR